MNKFLTFITLLLSLLFSLTLLSGEVYNCKIIFSGNTFGHPLSFDGGKGGYAARKTLIDRLTEGYDKKHLVIVDTGGLFGGRPEAYLYNYRLDLTGMNDIGYEISGLGYSEVRTSPAEFDRVNSTADFYYLSANVYHITPEGEEERMADLTYVKRIGTVFKNINIGFFSVMDNDLDYALMGKAKEDIIIKDYIESAQTAVTDLREKKKVDIVIGLTYLGVDGENSSRKLAEKVSGIDIIIDGRNFMKQEEIVQHKDTYIFKTADRGLYIGEIDLTIEDGSIVNVDFNNHSVNADGDGSIVPDDKVEAKFKRISWNFDNLMKRKLTTVKTENLNSKDKMTTENTLCNLITDSMKERMHVDIAFQNAGGVSEAEIKNGINLNRNSFDSILPYNNLIYIYKMSGKEIKDILDFSFKRIGYGQFLHYSGIEVKYSKGSRSVTEVLVDGKALSYDMNYTVAVNSWLSSGGDGYSFFVDNSSGVNTGMYQKYELAEYVNGFKTLEPVVDGRLKIVD